MTAKKVIEHGDASHDDHEVTFYYLTNLAMERLVLLLKQR